MNKSILTAVVIETMDEVRSDSITKLLWFGKHHIPIEHQIASVIAKLVYTFHFGAQVRHGRVGSMEMRDLYLVCIHCLGIFVYAVHSAIGTRGSGKS